MASLFSKMKSLHRKAEVADRSKAKKGDGVDRNAVSRLCFHGCSVFISAVDLIFQGVIFVTHTPSRERDIMTSVSPR